MGFVKFMSSVTGRVARVVAGLALIALGVVLGGGWLVLAVVGLVPLGAGLLDVCLFRPVLRAPFSGKRARSMSRKAGA